MFTPIDGSRIATVNQVTEAEYDAIVDRAHSAFLEWRKVPAPLRGEVVRQLGERLRANKEALGALVTLEMGKIRAEGEGEVQEMIDICDFAVGLSRQLYGLTMASERPDHHMREQWHPLGVVGVISAFNFPVAVWSWNAAIAAVCGDATLWKPASGTPADRDRRHADRVGCLPRERGRSGGLQPGGGPWFDGGRPAAARPAHPACLSHRLVLPSGKRVAAVVGNAPRPYHPRSSAATTPSSSRRTPTWTLAIPSILFGAVGTAGQRCTSTRRVVVHRSVRDELVSRLVRAYRDVRIGNPLDDDTLMGPVVNRQAVDDLLDARRRVVDEGGEILYGGECLAGDRYPGGLYVTPCIAAAGNHFEIVQHETFAPILYIIDYGSPDATPATAVAELDEAIALHNGVPQGLSSSIFTDHVREAEHFLSHRGSDCGIANVNIGTSGAEIGGAFGGEKETGGGRESGSDSWKAYMRRQTNTVNWSTELPLAQGIEFG